MGRDGARISREGILTLSGTLSGGPVSNASARTTPIKTGTGTLILTSVNTYTAATSAPAGTEVQSGILSIANQTNLGGGTTIGAGRVTISADPALGAAAGGITVAGGTPASTETMTAARNVAVGGSSGIFQTDDGTVLTLGGTLSGTGALTRPGGCTLKLTGDSSGFGDTTTVAAGELVLADGAVRGGALSWVPTVR
ncbi:hypothetical protein [Ancylobacter sp. IITR112]|uniref:hypothetical protein n=1 Tax=Ancylobacter sp. IITR112 TaxID=3138073 RepID=UPI00352A19F1